MDLSDTIARLHRLAAALGPLKEDTVLVGGLLVPLWLTDPFEEEPRPTKDADLILPPMSHAEFIERYDKPLRDRQFTNGTEPEDPVCRWRFEHDIIVDFMPVDSPFIGTNRWYSAALAAAVTKNIDTNLSWLVITPPYVLLTKIEAYLDRGQDDIYESHDLEDIISLVNGRIELLLECQELSAEERTFIAEQCQALMDTPGWNFALDGHLNPATHRRTVVMDRFRTLVAQAP